MSALAALTLERLAAAKRVTPRPSLAGRLLRACAISSYSLRWRLFLRASLSPHAGVNKRRKWETSSEINFWSNINSILSSVDIWNRIWPIMTSYNNKIGIDPRLRLSWSICNGVFCRFAEVEAAFPKDSWFGWFQNDEEKSWICRSSRKVLASETKKDELIRS